MNKDFENYIELLAKDLHDAAAMKAWDIPIAHRTKDSISAYRAAVGIVGAVMLKALEKYRNPERKVLAAGELSDNDVSVLANSQMDEKHNHLDADLKQDVEAPLAAPQSLFSDEPSPEPRRRRRNTGENDAA